MYKVFNFFAIKTIDINLVDKMHTTSYKHFIEGSTRIKIAVTIYS